MKKVKWGIIGTGKIAGKFASDIKKAPSAELIAAASRSPEKSKAFIDQYGGERSYGSYEQLYADREIDAVYIATPHTLHFENSRDALMAGKAVLCEKPITLDPEQLTELKKIHKESGQYLMEGMWTYFLPHIQKALKWIENGRIGQITHIKSDFGFRAPFDPKGRLFNPDLAGGAMLDIGIYPLAINWLVMKKDPLKITAVGRKAETGVDLESTYILEYEDVTSAHSCSLQSRLPNAAFIIGTEGYIELPLFWMGHEALLYKDMKVVKHFSEPRDTVGYEFETEAVSQDIIAGKKESDVMPLAYSMKLQEHMQAVLKQFM